ncbi:sugar ABC transporter substrate-binding protein [Saccharopolyspora pogona]|uniref:sugar ABC transporter substrate-binding protein n=1 Tax=Saccharopolyspora pogona TaxID=333966 RepID=UPI001CC25497|nr:sugar ABC transporter substrate-binding protein [Saccharopolyspora pogona]
MPKIRSTSVAAIAASALVLGLAGCAQQGDASNAVNSNCKKTYTVGFSNPYSEAVSVKAIKKFVQKRAEEQGCVKALLDNTTAANLESQRSTIEGWITQKVDAIVVLPVDATALVSLQKRAQTQGTKWLTYSSEMKGQDGSVGFDSHEGGKLIADDMTAWLQKHYPHGGVSAAVTTLVNLPGFAGRTIETVNALNKLNIPIVSKQDCADSGCGLQIAEDALREHPDLRVFIGLNDDAGVGALKAFQNAGLNPDDVYIAGADGAQEALEAIKKGTAYKASAAWPLKELGTAIVDLSIAAVDGKGSADSTLHHVLATPRNPADVDQLLDAFSAK